MVFGHLGQILSGGFITKTYLDIQLLGLPVPIFFFLSGYGMTCSLKSKCDSIQYWKQYTKKKLLGLVVPLLFSGALYFIILQLIINKMTFANAFLKCISDIKKGYTITLNAWYVYLLIWFSFVFLLSFMSYKKDEKRKNTIIRIAFLTLILIFSIAVMLFVFHWGGWWSKSCFAFPAGVIWGFYHKRLEKILSKYSIPVLILSAFVYVLPWICENVVKNSSINKLGTMLRFASSCAIVLLLLLLLSSFRFKSAVFSNIGKYSFEIYLIHGLIYSILIQSKKLQELDFLFVILTFAISYSASIPMHIMFQKLKGKQQIPKNT